MRQVIHGGRKAHGHILLKVDFHGHIEDLMS